MSKTQKTKINTVSSINSVSNQQYQDSLRNTQKLLKKYKKVNVMIPRQFRNILGNMVPITINGVSISIPVDGESYPVPEPYAKILHESLQTIQAEDVKPEVIEQLELKDSPVE